MVAIDSYNSLDTINLGNLIRLGAFVVATLLISKLNQARQVGLRQEHQLQVEAAIAHCKTAQMLEHMTNACVAIDRGWHTIYMNAEAEQFNKKPRLAMLGKTYWEVCSAFLTSDSEHQFRQAMTERVATHFEHRYYAPLHTLCNSHKTVELSARSHKQRLQQQENCS